MTATLSQVKDELFIAGTADDDKLTLYLNAANHAVSEASGETDWTEHPNLLAAAVLLVKDWFDAGEVKGTWPGAVVDLINLSKTGWVKA